MTGRSGLKRLVKRTAGWAAVASDLLGLWRDSGGACIFVYHRVADVGYVDPNVDDWNVPPAVFAEQVRALAEVADVVPLSELGDRMRRRQSGRPLAAITIDDGYACVRTNVLPVLERYRVPATCFLVTRWLESALPFPFDRWAAANLQRTPADAWRPLTWREIDECAASGLMTFGSHSHTHPDARHCTPAALADEVGRARAVLQARLGEMHAAAFAYPYGSSRLGHVNDAYVDAVRAAGHTLAVTTDLALVTPDSDPLRWPRLEAHVHDSRAVLRAKARGAIAPYHVTDRLRQAERTR